MKPKKDNWREYACEFTVVHPLGNPYFYIEHSLKLGGSWKTVYCLGTPHELTNGQIQADPLGVEECRKIIVPGYNCPLHECESELGTDNAYTRVQYRFAVINWTTGALQIMDAPETSLLKFFQTLQEVSAARNGALDLMEITWKWTCETSGSIWKNVIQPVYHELWHSKQDIQKLWADAGMAKRWESIEKYWSRAQTPDQIREALGATVEPPAGFMQDQRPPAAVDPATGLTPGESVFGGAGASGPMPDFFGGAAATPPAPLGPLGGGPLGGLNTTPGSGGAVPAVDRV
jgi:hypothetical protein